ncbi:MAG: hypothetical protein HRU70_06030 [Phycisphaeraceae bacterium]|nr:MAG: hypothetical protein HRU70_06030 [Phycisphaeraceae bacterium]
MPSIVIILAFASIMIPMIFIAMDQRRLRERRRLRDLEGGGQGHDQGSV